MASKELGATCCQEPSPKLFGATSFSVTGPSYAAEPEETDDLVSHPDAEGEDVEGGPQKSNLVAIGAMSFIWIGAGLFVSVQVVSLVLSGESFFGVLTRGVVESLKLPTGKQMWWHMLTGSLLWLLGAVQIVGKQLRHNHPVVHRWCGRAFLLIWLLAVGPTAAYLSLFSTAGPGAIGQMSMAMFSVISLDTTFFAYYFFYRAFLVALRRTRGAESLVLHGQAMVVGIFLTMTILFQRPFQLLIICFREFVLLLARVGPWPAWWSQLVEGAATSILDHHVVLAVTTAAGGHWLFAMVDGPRSVQVAGVMQLTQDDSTDLFGSPRATFWETMAWRCRVPVYIFLRYMVTRAWTVDLTSPSDLHILPNSDLD